MDQLMQAAVTVAAVALDYAAPVAVTDLPFMQQVIDTFQTQNPGTKINFNNITGRYETGAIPTWAAAGSLPDVLFVRGAYTGEFVAKHFIQAHLWAAGGALLSDDLSTCVVNDPAYAEKNATILQYFADLRNFQHIVPTSTEFTGNPFAKDKSGLEVDGSWATLSYRQQINKQFDWDVQWWPQNMEAGKRGVFATRAGESIGPTTKQRDTAWTWLKALTSREAVVTMIAQPIRSVPGRQSAAQIWTTTVQVLCDRQTVSQ